MKKHIFALTTLFACVAPQLCALNVGNIGGQRTGLRDGVHGFQAEPDPWVHQAPDAGAGMQPNPEQNPRPNPTANFGTKAVNHARGHFASWNYLGLDLVSEALQALALRPNKAGQIRALHLLAMLMKGVNIGSSTTTALAPPYTPNHQDLPLRLLAGLMTAFDTMDVVRSGKMFKNAQNIARLYRSNPALLKLARTTSKKRIMNRGISLGLALLTVPFIKYVLRIPGHTDASWMSVFLVYNILSHFLINRKGENYGLEKFLIEQAGQLPTIKHKKKKPKPAKKARSKPGTFAEMTEQELEELLQSVGNKNS